MKVGLQAVYAWWLGGPLLVLAMAGAVMLGINWLNGPQAHELTKDYRQQQQQQTDWLFQCTKDMERLGTTDMGSTDTPACQNYVKANP